MKVYVPGHKGLVGSAVLRMKPSAIEVVTRERSELDLTDYKSMLRFFEKEKFDGFVLCAARVGGGDLVVSHACERARARAHPSPVRNARAVG